MLKLVSPKEEWRWSFLDGYHIFKYVVYIMDKKDIYKYQLIDEDGNKVNYDIEECLEEN